jgi:hypothetical protein
MVVVVVVVVAGRRLLSPVRVRKVLIKAYK